MSKFIVLEVPDNYSFKKKFHSHQVMFCGDERCGYHTIDLRMMVDHIFYHPRHNDLPKIKEKELAASH